MFEVPEAVVERNSRPEVLCTEHLFFYRTSPVAASEVYFSSHQRNIVCEYKLHGKPIMKYQSWTCFWYWCWKNLFFNVKLKLLMINFNVSQFHEHIFRSSRSQMFFKIGALKNFAIFWIKKRLQQRYFAVNIAKFLTAAISENTTSGCFCIFKSN